MGGGHSFGMHLSSGLDRVQIPSFSSVSPGFLPVGGRPAADRPISRGQLIAIDFVDRRRESWEL